MFTIIGGDNKPYGPSSAEEVRAWLTQGRADGRTLARKDDGEWKPLAAFPEFADLTGATGATPPPLSHTWGRGASPMPTPDEILRRDFEIDIGSCLKRSWELVQGNFWPVVGITFLVIMAVLTINHFIDLISEPAITDMWNEHRLNARGVALVCLTSILCAPVQAIFTGGLYVYYLKLIRGEEAGMNDAFSGFTRALSPLAMVGLMVTLLTILGTGLCLLPGLYLSVGWIFAVPLVVDRRMDFWSAMKLSLKVINKHWFMVFALLVVSGLVGVCGIVVFCLGIFVSLPVGYLMLMFAYEDIFGPRAH